MNRLRLFLSSLRGRLILTYTLVTVLALLTLEILCIIAIVFIFGFLGGDRSAYLADAIFTLGPRASVYMQPNALDTKGLQVWLDQVYTSRHASSEPLDWTDSPAAILIENKPIYVVSTDQTILAVSPYNSEVIGKTFTATDGREQTALDRALEGNQSALRLYTVDIEGNYFLGIPVFYTQPDKATVMGAVIVTVKPPPPYLLTILPFLALAVGITAIILLVLVAPFGALFGFIMSRGLTKRLANLSNAADAWSEGNFTVIPQDRSNDEISTLGTRLRNMAERIQTLLRTQQELAMLEERNRIARELHDTIKQQNFATLMQIRAARNQLAADPNAAAQALSEAEHLIKTSQQELGIIITELRPTALEQKGLARALELYLETWSHQSNIKSTFSAHNQKPLAPELELSLYRVAQEALANIARHSHATAVNLALTYAPNEMNMILTDNGTGFDVKDAQGFGLASMQERITALGGTFKIMSANGNGTTLSVRVPLVPVPSKGNHAQIINTDQVQDGRPN